MTYKITIPGRGKKLNTKDMILSLLSQEYPLTAKQISQRIRKQFGSNITFPGVYKAINQLIDDEVLTKEGTNVKIHNTWIKQTKAWIDKLQKKYLETGERGEQIYIGEDVQVYYMDNLIDLDKFWIKILEEWFEDPDIEDDSLTQLSGHAWYVLGQLENEEECLRTIKKHKLRFYTVVNSDTFLDKWSGKYYTDKNFFYTTKKQSDIKYHNHYYIIYGEYVMEAVYPEKLAKDLDQIYSTVKKIDDLDLVKVIEILKRKEKLKITVMKNKPLAKQLRKELLSHWEKN